MSITALFVTALGGGLGAVARFHLGVLIKRQISQEGLPNAMLIVNVLGSFGLGLMMGLLFDGVVASDSVPLVFYFGGTGFWGAFTTYSTFSVEAIQLIKKKAFGPACLYVILSIAGSFVAFLLGVFLF
ncbi:fluoride efflux transporter CrcB [Salisediminibacterium beveridgei]|uniref:Fluoride-specific ion channel FluC n=1 Tax=Salisediminibacterium beveridgei TaxID=632773 RepID=A0A1D7QYT3_9BACI|nr:fluoride efflux transporter CrcB [Salisediminibacterium beveridgei]AOM84160.1 chromosome condensation protein CrcB [Salisediminibacterium beveridgei]